MLYFSISKRQRFFDFKIKNCYDDFLKKFFKKKLEVTVHAVGFFAQLRKLRGNAFKPGLRTLHLDGHFADSVVDIAN